MLGTELQARCPVTDADSKHSIDQRPMLGKFLLSFSYLDIKRLQTSKVARGTSPTCPAFLNLLSRTTSWSGSHAMYFTPSGRKRGSAQHVHRLIPCFDLNLIFWFDKHWKRSKSKHSIDWAPIPVFDDDPTCYLNAWDFLGDTKIHIVSSETGMA